MRTKKPSREELFELLESFRDELDQVMPVAPKIWWDGYFWCLEYPGDCGDFTTCANFEDAVERMTKWLKKHKKYNKTRGVDLDSGEVIHSKYRYLEGYYD